MGDTFDDFLEEFKNATVNTSKTFKFKKVESFSGSTSPLHKKETLSNQQQSANGKSNHIQVTSNKDKVICRTTSEPSVKENVQSNNKFKFKPKESSHVINNSKEESKRDNGKVSEDKTVRDISDTKINNSSNFKYRSSLSCKSESQIVSRKD